MPQTPPFEKILAEAGITPQMGTKARSIPNLILDDDIKPPDGFLYNTLLSRGEVTLLAGVRNIGKTYLTLELGACIATGKPFGHIDVRQGRVLYVSQEMGIATMRRRVIRLLAGRADEIGDTMSMLFKVKGLKMDHDDGADMLCDLIEDNPADVVIIDALRDIRGSCQENSNDEMGDLMVRLRDQVAQRAEVAILLIHHMGKPREDGHRSARGATTIEDSAADAIYLIKERDSTKRYGIFDKVRDGPQQGERFGYSIYGDEETGTVEVRILTEDSPEDREDADIAKLASDLVKSGEQLKSAEIGARMGWSKPTTRRRLERATNLGMLAKTAERPARYYAKDLNPAF